MSESEGSGGAGIIPAPDGAWQLMISSLRCPCPDAQGVRWQLRGAAAAVAAVLLRYIAGCWLRVGVYYWVRVLTPPPLPKQEAGGAVVGGHGHGGCVVRPMTNFYPFSDFFVFRLFENP
jgi:hypothetical protein